MSRTIFVSCSIPYRSIAITIVLSRTIKVINCSKILLVTCIFSTDRIFLVRLWRPFGHTLKLLILSTTQSAYSLLMLVAKTSCPDHTGNLIAILESILRTSVKLTSRSSISYGKLNSLRIESGIWPFSINCSILLLNFLFSLVAVFLFTTSSNYSSLSP